LDALRGLPDREGLVFKNRIGQAYYWRKLWDKITVEAGFEGYNFHLLRHSCGSAMAKAGVSQANIMNIMGHRTLHASKRYMHLNTSGKAEVIAKVFG
jgi:integrase